MSNSVDEAVMLFVSAYFADQKTGVENKAGNDRSEENYSEEYSNFFLPVENDPTKTHGHGGRSQKGG